ncbi:HEPN domain-containing protein [Bdellovibrionota bacterium FG-2]
MKNRNLITDYLKRSEARLAALDVLYQRESWADVVRESQEIVELSLKALLRSASIECPRVHDVGDILTQNEGLFSVKVKPKLEKLAEVSRSLRRDRELAFYGSEDLTPSEFYREQDAKKAREYARWVVEVVKAAV